MWVEPVNERHALGEFACGSKAMDDWLARHALDNEAIGVSRTFVLTDDGVAVLGYYTLVGMSEEQGELPRSLRRGTPQRVDQPGSLLARLAVASAHQGKGLGRDLFVDAVRLAAEAAERVGGRFVAVDPIDERARAVYTGWGFEQVIGDEGGRLFIGLAKAIASFVLAEEEGSA